MGKRFFFEVGKRGDYGIVLDDGSKFFVAGHPDATWMFIYAPPNTTFGTVLFTYKSLGSLLRHIRETGIIEKLEKEGFINLGKYKGIPTDKQRKAVAKAIELASKKAKVIGS